MRKIRNCPYQSQIAKVFPRKGQLGYHPLFQNQICFVDSEFIKFKDKKQSLE